MKFEGQQPRRQLLDILRQRYYRFKVNFGWSRWSKYIDGWTPRFAALFPMIGYLIIFNDGISEFISFENLTSEETVNTGLSTKMRLQFIYFGFIFLGLSNLAYRFKRPRIFRFGSDAINYSTKALEVFTRSDFIRIHGRIRYEGHASLDGKYYDSEWEGFLESS